MGVQILPFIFVFVSRAFSLSKGAGFIRMETEYQYIKAGARVKIIILKTTREIRIIQINLKIVLALIFTITL